MPHLSFAGLRVDSVAEQFFCSFLETSTSMREASRDRRPFTSTKLHLGAHRATEEYRVTPRSIKGLKEVGSMLKHVEASFRLHLFLQQPSPVVENCSHCSMFGAIHGLVDRSSSFVQTICFSVLALRRGQEREGSEVKVSGDGVGRSIKLNHHDQLLNVAARSEGSGLWRSSLIPIARRLKESASGYRCGLMLHRESNESLRRGIRFLRAP